MLTVEYDRYSMVPGTHLDDESVNLLSIRLIVRSFGENIPSKHSPLLIHCSPG